MTTSTSNTGWLASAESLLTRASTAAGFAPKGHTGPARELTTLATERPNKPAASRWDWWGTKASSPIAPTPQDTASTVSVAAKPQASGWLSTYNPFTRWTGAKATAEPSASAAPAENNNITHLASTKVDEWLSKTREVPQTAETLYTELKSLTVDERNKLFRSAPHMCGGNWEKTMWYSLTPSQLKELEIDVDTTQQDTTGKGLRAAWKNAAQGPQELTTLPSMPAETKEPRRGRRKSVAFADTNGPKTGLSTGGASTAGGLKSILKKHLPTPAASSLVTVN